MRRPPSNLDDFLHSGEGPVTEPIAPAIASDTAASDTAASNPESRHPKPTAATPTKQKATRRKASKPAAERAAPSKTRISNTRKAKPSMTESTEIVERQRARTVPGEASATVIMSVRVPIELRERLEDILAAYSGVTFSDLVIRGLQGMVNEVEERHQERTGRELPRRETRPEFPL